MDVKGDIELALNSAQLFSQTLSFTDPTAEDISKNELIQVNSCQLCKWWYINQFDRNFTTTVNKRNKY